MRARGTPGLGADAWWSGVALAMAVIAPLLAYIANLGLAVATGLAGLACIAAVRPPRTWPWGVWALLALLGWALVSYAWSPLAPALGEAKTYRKLDAITGLKLVSELGFYGAFVAAMARLDGVAARRALDWLTVGLAFLLTMLLVEALSDVFIYRHLRDLVRLRTREDYPIHHIARGCYVAVVLFWPVAFGLLRQGLAWAAAAFWGLTLLCCLLLHVDSPLAALLISTAVAAAVRFGRAWAVWTCGAGVLIYLLLAPMVFGIGAQDVSAGGLSALGKASWGARTVVWRFVAQQIATKPVFGWGLDASRAWPHVIPLHPHDAALQIWLELGAVGTVLAAAFVAWFFQRLARLAKIDAQGASASTASAIAFVVIGALSFGVWQEWWIATGAIAAGACLWFARTQHVWRPADEVGAAADGIAAGEVTPYFP